MTALPAVKKEVLKLPRAYIANVIYTMVGKDFENWAAARIQARNEKVVKEKEMAIAMDPEIAEIFKQSTSVSGKQTVSQLYFYLSD